MQRLEVRGAVRPIYGSLGVKRLRALKQKNKCKIEPATAVGGVHPREIPFHTTKVWAAESTKHLLSQLLVLNCLNGQNVIHSFIYDAYQTDLLNRRSSIPLISDVTSPRSGTLFYLATRITLYADQCCNNLVGARAKSTQKIHTGVLLSP